MSGGACRSRADNAVVTPLTLAKSLSVKTAILTGARCVVGPILSGAPDRRTASVGTGPADSGRAVPVRLGPPGHGTVVVMSDLPAGNASDRVESVHARWIGRRPGTGIRGRYRTAARRRVTSRVHEPGSQRLTVPRARRGDKRRRPGGCSSRRSRGARRAPRTRAACPVHRIERRLGAGSHRASTNRARSASPSHGLAAETSAGDPAAVRHVVQGGRVERHERGLPAPVHRAEIRGLPRPRAAGGGGIRRVQRTREPQADTLIALAVTAGRGR